MTWSRWVALIERREDATSLAVCRIIVGLTVAADLAQTWWHGVVTTAWVDSRWGGVRHVVAPWLDPIGGATPRNVQAAVALAIVAALCLAAGAFTRAACIATWYLYQHLVHLNSSYSASCDLLLNNLLFILIVSGCGRALSVDARWRGQGGDAPSWPRRLLVYQLVLVYTLTAVQKISASWIPGGPADALWYILQQPTWQRRPMLWLAPAYPITQVATLVTWLFEASAPLLLLAIHYRATADRPGRLRALFNRVDFRRWYLILGASLHVGIWLTMDLGPFLPAMLAFYSVCIDPEEWLALGRRFGRLRRRSERRSAAA